MVKASDTGGVRPMNLAGRLVRERERLLGMTDEERAYRKQWLQDQHLSKNEPKYVPELYYELHNPIKRAYRYPLDQMQKLIAPIVGESRALKIRYVTGKICLLSIAAFVGGYYFKYNSSDWTKKGGLKVLQSRPSILPGDPGYPRLSDKSKPSDYYTLGFDKVDVKLD